MKQKIVIKVGGMNGGHKSRSKALKIAVGAAGVESAGFTGKELDQIEVVGEGIDAALLTSLLRKKVGPADLLIVDSVVDKKEKEKEKEKEKKKDRHKIDQIKLLPLPDPYPYSYPYPIQPLPLRDPSPSSYPYQTQPPRLPPPPPPPSSGNSYPDYYPVSPNHLVSVQEYTNRTADRCPIM